MLKFLHCADLHLDSPFKGLYHLPTSIFKRIQNSTFQAFKKVVQTAIQEEVDFVIIAGDLYDGQDRSLRAQTRLRRELERLSEKNIPVYIVHGNHDHLEGKWVDLHWPESVHFFSGGQVESIAYEKDGKRLAMIHGFSYEKRAVMENRVHLYPDGTDECYHIGILHGNAEGRSGHDPYAPFQVEELIGKNYDYWALGHIHKRIELHHDPPIIYPGNIQGRHPKETGKKGCYVIQLNGKQATAVFHETQDIIWHEEKINIASFSNLSELVEKSLQIKEGLREYGKGVLVKLILEGDSDFHHELNGQFLDEMLEMIQEGEEEHSSFVYPYQIIVKTMPKWDREKLVNETHFVGGLLRNIDSYEEMDQAVSELFLHKKARRYLEAFTSEEKKELMKEAESLLLMSLLKE